MEVKKDIYFKQKLLYNPEEDQPRIFVYGCGSIGSHVITGLAKTGFKDITIYDYDSVEDSNIPAQFFGIKHIGEKKIEAIADVVSQFVPDIEINKEEVKIDGEFIPELSKDSIHILCFDNIEARKILSEMLFGYPLLIIDGRIGSFNIEKYTFLGTNKNLCKDYSKTLEGEFSKLKCGEKTLWPVNAYIGSKIVADVLKYIKNEELRFSHITNLKGDVVLGK